MTPLHLIGALAAGAGTGLILFDALISLRRIARHRAAVRRELRRLRGE